MDLKHRGRPGKKSPFERKTGRSAEFWNYLANSTGVQSQSHRGDATFKRPQPQQPVHKQPEPEIFTDLIPKKQRRSAKKAGQGTGLRSKQRALVIILPVIIVIGLGSFIFLQNRGKSKTSTSNTGTEQAVQGESDVYVALPSSDEENDISVPTTQTPPTNETPDGTRYLSEKNVATRTDKIGDITITITQQPLPESFKKNPNASVEKLLAKYTNKEKLVVNGITAFVGTSADGSQLVVFQTKGLLVFMVSKTTISSDDWMAYLASIPE